MYTYVYVCIFGYAYDTYVNNVESCVHIYIVYLVLESIVELLKTLMCS